jgi:integrase
MPYKRAKSPYYWVTYTDPETGKQVCRSSGTAVFAEAKALEQKLRVEAHADKQRAKTDVRVGDILAEYLEPRLDNPPTKAAAKRLLSLADYWHSDLTTAVIRAYIKDRLDKGEQPGTVNKALGILSSAVNNYNLDHSTNLFNPVKGLKLKEPEGRLRYLTREEYTALLSVAEGYLRDFIILGVQTGMRRGELMRLRWDRVDLGQRFIHLHAEDTKARKPRSIPLNDEAVRCLAARLGDKVNDYVFHSTNPKAEHLTDPKKSFATACRRAQLVGVSPHILRHTTASWMAIAGVPMLEICKILGHSSMQVTMRYAHLAPGHLRSAVDALCSKSVVSANDTNVDSMR